MCWNCGFVCDSKRDALGGADDRAGTNTEFEQTTLPDNHWITYGQKADIPKIMRGQSHTVLVKVGPDGAPLPIMLSYSPTVDRGCPMCGTLNWRGDYR
jgi:hypothetical protein